MSLEITGKITHVLEIVSGTSAKGDWKKQQFVIETPGDYPKSVCIEVWNDKVSIPPIGTEVNASINVESREYNGKWYSDVKVWKMDVVGEAEIVHKDIPEKSNEPIETDDLPF